MHTYGHVRICKLSVGTQNIYQDVNMYTYFFVHTFNKTYPTELYIKITSEEELHANTQADAHMHNDRHDSYP